MICLNIINYPKTSRLGLIPVLILLFSLISFTVHADESLTILYTGFVLGEIEPCGCSEEADIGGILRRATIIEQERSKNKNVLLLDAGDSFKDPTEQGKLKAKTIIESLYKMDYDAALLGEKDFIYGEEIINKGSFNNWILSNIEIKNLEQKKTKKYLLKELNDGTKIAVIGLLGPELVYAKGQTNITIEKPLVKLKELLLKLKAKDKVDITLLLTHMEKEKAKELLSYKDVDIIINGHLDEEELIVDPEISGNKIMVHVRERGQYLGKIKLDIQNHKIQNISNEYIKLAPKINDSQLVQQIYDNYNEEAKLLFMKWVQDKKKAKKKVFVSANGCKMCHKAAYEIWKKADHSHAYNSLVKAKKTFDPECLKCHTTGFKQEGGFVTEDITPNLLDVQCEACHGAGRKHVSLMMRGRNADQKKLQNPYKKLTRDACLPCHTRENSPGFDFVKYWEKIKH